MILYNRLAHIARACFAKRLVARLRIVAAIASELDELPIVNGLSVDEIHAFHRKVDAIGESLAVEETSSNDEERTKEFQRLSIVVCPILNRIKMAVARRYGLIMRSLSDKSTVSTTEVMRSSAAKSTVSTAEVTERKAANCCRQAPTILEENRRMHGKLTQLQKAMSRRRRSKLSRTLGKKCPPTVRAPPPARGFGGLRRGFLL